MQQQETLIKLPEVLKRTGISKPFVYALMAKGAFPQAVKIGRRAVAWPASEIDAWIARKIEGSKQ